MLTQQCVFKTLVVLQRIKMEYQKLANLLDNEINQPFKFRTKNWVAIDDESRGQQILVMALDLKVQCYDLIYVIMQMHIYL